MNNDKIKQHLDQYLNYWVIGIISLLALFFLPFLGSAAGLALVLPTTVAGWFVYIATKIIIAIINVLIFHCFFQQAKVNIKDNSRYIEALEILDQFRIKERVYRSPEEYTRGAYLKKGTTIFIMTILGAFSLTHAILVFDLVMFLTYTFTIVMGVIFGVLQMKSGELYWTDELWYYAKKIEKEAKEAEEKAKEAAEAEAKAAAAQKEEQLNAKQAEYSTVELTTAS
jgi:hypothetical protein